MSSLPACARPHLELVLDAGNEVNEDLNTIAAHMSEWKSVASHLGLTNQDVQEITVQHAEDPELGK